MYRHREHTYIPSDIKMMIHISIVCSLCLYICIIRRCHREHTIKGANICIIRHRNDDTYVYCVLPMSVHMYHQARLPQGALNKALHPVLNRKQIEFNTYKYNVYLYVSITGRGAGVDRVCVCAFVYVCVSVCRP